MSDYRERFLDYIESQLMGPPLDITHKFPYQKRFGPEKNYIMGRLFPQGSFRTENDEEERERIVSSETDPLSLAFEKFPSSVGISFLVSQGTRLSLIVGGAFYEEETEKVKNESKDDHLKWVRNSFSNTLEVETSPGIYKHKVLNNKAELHIKCRSSSAGILVTATLINALQMNKRGPFKTQDVIFRSQLECLCQSGKVLPYPKPFRKGSDEEEEEMSILYRDRFTFAVGHGCSSSWQSKGKNCESVSINFIPRVYLKGVVKDPEEMKSLKVLYLQYLASDSTDPSSLLKELNKFLDIYENWIQSTLKNLNNIKLEGSLQAKKRIEEGLINVHRRMKKGAAFLCKDTEALKAFKLANLAMQMQMVHSREDFTYSNDLDYLANKDWENRWYPFQLAFFLLTVESTANEDHEDREVVEVLWFPTGGGKTEAYFLLSAFQILRKWLNKGVEKLGTTVLMRYTLQLLTADQFLRASKLICALELIRREREDQMARSPITIGLWAGLKVCPNTFMQAHDKYNSMINEEYPETRFQIDICPWCATKLIPNRRSSPKKYGFISTTTSFKIRCLEKGCPFHNELPVNIIDEHLYESPPTFLVSTVDKFARTAWTEGPGKFLGSEGYDPPSLIIQDELHLISGPLGTIYGVYESAFDLTISTNGGKPKIISATATIRGSSKQAKGLYGRSAQLFPPSGCDANDSFFTKTDDKDIGRLYIGMMPLGVTPTSTTVNTLASLLQGTSELTGSSDEVDSYSTLVSYHTTRRELGKAITLIRDDIPNRMRSIYQSTQRILDAGNIKELSSNISRDEARKTRQRMELRKGQDNFLEAVLCTNMISVGVDIPRLGLMHINGQPKTTSEFIQASSRVGRGKIPGMVFINYKGTQPRDRSHFEQFKSYLESIYRFVEPTSVTPTAHPARKRALHAAFIVLMRHACGYSDNGAANQFKKDNPEVLKVKS